MYSEDHKLCTVVFLWDHYSISTCFMLSVVGYTSACLKPLCSEPSNGAADSGDGCLHSGKYEIKRKSLINWQQAPQDREAGDGMISLTWGWSTGPLRRGWWIYSRVWCSGCRFTCCFVCSLLLLGFTSLYWVRTFVKARHYSKTNTFHGLVCIVPVEK